MILNRIEAEEIADDARKDNTAKKKAITRQRLLRQHERNIERERMGGVYKQYSGINNLMQARKSEMTERQASRGCQRN
jgi:hypothetical protein